MEIKEITKAIIKVMQEVNNIGKNTTVGKGNNAYKAVSDKDVKKAIRESMGKNGLSLVPTGVQSKIQIDRWEEETNYGLKTKQSVFTEVETKYLLLHTSGESIEIYGYGQGVDSQDKGAGKATTYALKNVLIGLFLVPTGDDTDNTHSDNIAVPQKKKPKYFNYEDLVSATEAGATNGEAIKEIIKQDGFTVSGKATKAIKHYLETGEISKDLFFNK